MSGVFGSPTTNEPPAPGVYGGGWPTDTAEAHLAAIRAALPADFRPDLPLVERVRALVAAKANVERELNAAVEYHKWCGKQIESALGAENQDIETSRYPKFAHNIRRLIAERDQLLGGEQ